MCCHSLLQGIFPTVGSNPGLQHCRQILYCLSHQGSPNQPYLNKIMFKKKKTNPLWSTQLVSVSPMVFPLPIPPPPGDPDRHVQAPSAPGDPTAEQEPGAQDRGGRLQRAAQPQHPGAVRQPADDGAHAGLRVPVQAARALAAEQPH